MGSPAMNFIPARLVEKDGGPGVRFDRPLKDGDHPLFLPLAQSGETLRDRLGTEVILGIRPENITQPVPGEMSANPHLIGFDCKVDVLEPTGADTLTYMTMGGSEVIARVRPHDVKPAGQVGRFMADMSKACLFDPKTEDRISL